jgi:hypothetical protein
MLRRENAVEGAFVCLLGCCPMGQIRISTISDIVAKRRIYFCYYPFQCSIKISAQVRSTARFWNGSTESWTDITWAEIFAVHFVTTVLNVYSRVCSMPEWNKGSKLATSASLKFAIVINRTQSIDNSTNICHGRPQER